MKLADFEIESTPDEGDIRETIRSFNDTRTDYPRDRSTHAIFHEQALRTPAATAVLHGDREFTYRDLDARSDQVARYLLSRDLAPESLVAVLLDDFFEFVSAILGIMKAGGGYLPIDHDAPADRIRYMLTDSAAPVFITQKIYLDRLAGVLPSCAALQSVVSLDGGDAPPGIELSSAAEFDRAPDISIGERSGPRGIAYVMYTSGTSGRPKGVIIEHRSIIRLVRNTNYISLNETDRFLMTGSFAFDASTLEVWGALLHGGAVCRPPEFAILDPGEMKRLIRRHRITTMFLTTSLFNQFADSDATLFHGLKTLLTGGERVSPRHVNKVKKTCPEISLIHCYGPTENTTFTTCHAINLFYEHDIPIGRPIANTQVLILDEEDQLVPVGRPGEICAAGDGLARGYLNAPELTARKFVPHPFDPSERIYRTGDRGRWTPDGAVEFLGRIDQQVKIRGYRIEPDEIESWIRKANHVLDAVVTVVERGPADRQLVAYVTGDGASDIGALRAFLIEHLPDYMIPSHFVPLGRLPLNANGKVDRNALPNPLLVKSADPAAILLPTTPTEILVAAVWCEVLGLERVGVTDNFFERGGHSLKVAAMVAAVKERTGVDFPLVAAFQRPTVRELAAYLVDAATYGAREADETVLLLSARDDAPPIFLFPPGTGDVLSYLQLADRLPAATFHAFNFMESESRMERYADMIAKIQSTGPYVLAGYSSGGNLAYHVAMELERRGEKVSDIIMFDSARKLEKFEYPDSEVIRIHREFIDHPSLCPYFARDVLKEKAFNRIKRYYEYNGDSVDDMVVDARIHVILSNNTKYEYRDETGKLLVSVPAWREIARGGCVEYGGSGEHGAVLVEPALSDNAAIVGEIISRIRAFERNGTCIS